MTNALSTKDELEQVADLLSKAADSIHAGAMNGLKDNICTQDDVYQIMEQEQALRSQANEILLHAAVLVVANLSVAQGELVGAVEKASGVMKKMEELNKFLSVASSVIALAGSIVASDPKGIVSSLGVLKDTLRG